MLYVYNIYFIYTIIYIYSMYIVYCIYIWVYDGVFTFTVSWGIMGMCIYLHTYDGDMHDRDIELY